MRSSPCLLALLMCAVAYGSNEYKAKYDAFDTDGNGVIDRDEFINGVASQGSESDTELEQDDWNENSKTSNFVETFMGDDDTTVDTPKNAMIDGGSSGSKLFTWKSDDKPVDNKVKSQCADTSKNPLKGMSMLSYNPEVCNCPKVGDEAVPAGDKKNQKTMGAFYASTIADEIKKLYQEKGEHPGALPKNAHEVPLMATAGMRLLTQEVNEKVYGFLCGQGSADVKIAGPGPFCGTLPGTMEAFYEWVANALESPDVEGTFTMGGASAQIAVPLTAADNGNWAKLTEDIKKELDCAKLVLPQKDGSVPAATMNKEGKCTNCAPVFGEGKNKPITSGSKDCLKDYIDQIDASDVPESVKAKGWWTTADPPITSVGTISFLGLHGGHKGNLVAGGANEMSAWAATLPGCKGGGTWADCSKEIKEGLDGDPIYKAAKAHLKNFKSAKDFSYNTPASHPDAQFVHHDDKDNAYATQKQGELADEVKKQGSAWHQAQELKKILNEQCGGVGEKYKMAVGPSGAKMGYEGHGDCAKAFWTALYTLDFFSETQAPGPIDTKKYDWSAGAIPHAMELLQTPLKRHTTTWHQGAMAHYDEVMDEMGGSSLADVGARSPWMDVLG